MSSSVQIKRNGAILEVTIDRPKANAIDASTSRELGKAFCAFRDDAELRVAILTGGGEKFFSAGWDLKAAAEGEGLGSEPDFGPGGFGGITQLHDLNKPVIAAVNGLAVGGGFEIALSADLMVVADHAEMFLPEIFVGVVPDAGCLRLPRRIPRAVALEMLLTGRRMGAEEAVRWGLANASVPGASLMDEARRLAGAIIEGAPLSIAAIKEVVRESEASSIEEGYAKFERGEFAAYEKMVHSRDAKEGPLAFSEKRAPVWQGR